MKENLKKTNDCKKRDVQFKKNKTKGMQVLEKEKLIKQLSGFKLEKWFCTIFIGRQWELNKRGIIYEKRQLVEVHVFSIKVGILTKMKNCNI